MRSGHLYLTAEEDWDDESCAICDEPFSTGAWEMVGHGGDAWGGSAMYECPNDCDGTATVLY